MAFLDTLISSVNICLISISKGGESCRLNRSAKDFFGENQLTLSDFFNRFVDVEKAEGIYRSADEGNETRDVVEIENALGQVEQFEVSASKVSDSVVFLLHSGRLQDVERSQQSRLERLASVGQLSTGITHEINNILTAILGWTQLALRDPYSQERVDSALHIIDENSRRAKSIIEDVMGFARSEEHRQGPTDLSEISDEVLRVLSWELKNAGVSVTKQYSEVPQVFADRRKIFQVFLNIVLNSLQAMPDGGKIHVTTGTTKGIVSIEFSDTGQGIEKAMLDRIFEPHFSTKTHQQGRNGGYGMGLSISKKIVSEHGGQISVSSIKGDGAAFTVKLPEVVRRSHPPEESRKTTRDLTPRMKILVVDTEADICSSVEESLEHQGMIVSQTSNGIEALAICRRERFDLALIDHTMPGTRGSVLTEKLRQLSPGIRIIVMSGRNEEISLEISGADSILRKPFSLEDLFRVVMEAGSSQNDDG